VAFLWAKGSDRHPELVSGSHSKTEKSLVEREMLNQVQHDRTSSID